MSASRHGEEERG